MNRERFDKWLAISGYSVCIIMTIWLALINEMFWWLVILFVLIILFIFIYDPNKQKLEEKK